MNLDNAGTICKVKITKDYHFIQDLDYDKFRVVFKQCKTCGIINYLRLV